MPNPGSVYINSTIGKWRVFSALERDTGIIEKANSTSTYGLRWKSNYGYWIMENFFVMFTCTGESPGGLYMWFWRLFAYRNASAAGSG